MGDLYINEISFVQIIVLFLRLIGVCAGPSGRAVEGVVLWPLACWDRGFKSHRGAWMFVCCECCVLSGRGLCDELITRPEESYRLCCVVVCDLETSWMRRPWPPGGAVAPNKKKLGCVLMLFCGKWMREYIFLLLILFNLWVAGEIRGEQQSWRRAKAQSHSILIAVDGIYRRRSSSFTWRFTNCGRSRPFAFGVFTCTEPRRAILFLAGSSETETQRWMRHIRDLLRPPQNDGTGRHTALAARAWPTDTAICPPSGLTLKSPN